MIYTLEPQNKTDLKATGIDRILQNGRNILSVVIGEVILARGIGINGDIVDSPLNRSAALMDIQTQFKKYEPRLKIHKIKYITDHQRGSLKPIMEVSIVE